jgi:hypothetical protein
VIDKSLLNEKPCSDRTYSASKPCPHLLAEQAARQKRHADDWKERAAGYKTEADKVMEAATAQGKAIHEGIRELVTELRGDPAPSAKSRKGKPDGGEG